MRLLVAGAIVIAIALGAVALDRSFTLSTGEPNTVTATFTVNQEGLIIGEASSVAQAPPSNSWDDDPNVLSIGSIAFAALVTLAFFGWHYLLGFRTRQRVIQWLKRFTA